MEVVGAPNAAQVEKLSLETWIFPVEQFDNPEVMVDVAICSEKVMEIKFSLALLCPAVGIVLITNGREVSPVVNELVKSFTGCIPSISETEFLILK